MFDLPITGRLAARPPGGADGDAGADSEPTSTHEGKHHDEIQVRSR